MKILQLVTVRQRRGAEVIASDLADAMCERGHEAVVVGLSAPPPEALDPKSARAFDLSRAGSARLDIRRVIELGRLLRQASPDIIQANGGYAVKYAVLAVALFRLDFPIIYCNIGMSSDWLRWPGQRAWNRWLLNRTCLTAAVSEASRDDLIDTYRLPVERVRVVRRGLAIEPVFSREHGRAILHQAGVPLDGPIVIHVGSYTPEKNHEGLLRIYANVQTRVPGVRLVLVGDGDLKPGIDARRIDGVHVLGVRSDVPELLSGADLFLLPSLTEGIPGAVLEAAVQRVPTVAYDVGGLREVVIQNVTGRLVPVENESAATEAACQLLLDDRLRETLGKAARAFVTREYDLQRSVDAFCDLYEAALATPDARVTAH